MILEDFFCFRTDERISITVRTPEIDLSLIRRLGKPKFWVSGNDFDMLMEKIYKTTSKRAQEMLFESETKTTGKGNEEK
jgi:hypothetical protein